MLAVALAAAMLAGCDASEEEEAAASGGGTVSGALPTPAGTGGGSVTGMPTTAPPPREAEVVEAPPAPATGELPAGVPPTDPNAIPVDPATGLAVGAVPPAGTGDAQPAQPGDASAAGAVVREYMAALGGGSFAAAQQLWSATPTDSLILELARGDAFAVDVLAAMRSADPAAAGVVTVPVRVRGSADDGSVRAVSATYTVRRTPEGQWRIASAVVREDAP